MVAAAGRMGGHVDGHAAAALLSFRPSWLHWPTPPNRSSTPHAHAQFSSAQVIASPPPSFLPSSRLPASSRTYFNVVSLDYFYLADRATDGSGGGGGGGGEVGETAAANHNCPSVRPSAVARARRPPSPSHSSSLVSVVQPHHLYLPPPVRVVRHPRLLRRALYRGMAKGLEATVFLVLISL